MRFFSLKNSKEEEELLDLIDLYLYEYESLKYEEEENILLESLRLNILEGIVTDYDEIPWENLARFILKCYKLDSITESLEEIERLIHQGLDSDGAQIQIKKAYFFQEREEFRGNLDFLSYLVLPERLTAYVEEDYTGRCIYEDALYVYVRLPE